MDREKVIAWLNEIVNTLGSFTDDSEQEVCQLAKDALALLQEQEHKDKMFHALEDDWKRLKELLKKQEAQKFFVDESGKITPLPVVVRCKDCKHRPKKPDWETYEDGADIEFPDGKCPCQCSADRYYSWYPDDEWFCAEGERKNI